MPEAATDATAFDVAIIGGGAMGLALATFLRREDPGCSVGVIERDPTYQFASTPRASGGLRRLFALPENIRMSDFGIRYFANLLRDRPMGQGWTQQGYLFIASPGKIDSLRRNLDVQLAHGVSAQMLSPEELRQRFPSMRVDDLGGGVLSPEDGWIVPEEALSALRVEAIDAGVALVEGDVVAIDHDAVAARSLVLKDGRRLRFAHMVNAAGAWAASICKLLGVEVPIEPMRRFEHRFERRGDIEPFPYIKDTERLAFRPAGGASYTGGLPQYTEPGGINFEVDHGYFDRVVRPALAHRVPALADCRLLSTRSGLYDQNRFDGNPIIGSRPGGQGNVWLISGFSGHGLMHVPAAARGLAEYIVHSRYTTLDLSRFGWERIVNGTPVREVGIV